MDRCCGPGHCGRAPARPAALNRAGRPMAGALVAVAFWGLAPVATRAVVAHLAPLPLLVLRLCGAALVLLPSAAPGLVRLRRWAARAARVRASGAPGPVRLYPS